jgi:hypothetical protein
MTEINFTSTYRIPITQAGVNPAKKVKLKELIESYPNGLIGKSKTGHARVSIPDSEDNKFIAKLKKLGYNVYQKFEGENIDKENLDVFIKEKLDGREFHQKGKSPNRMSRELKEGRRFKRSIDGEKAPSKNHLAREAELKAIREQRELQAKEQEEERQIMKEIEEYKKMRIRTSEAYLKLVEEEGKDFAEAVYFGIR